jgi:hypothetical protein
MCVPGQLSISRKTGHLRTKTHMSGKRLTGPDTDFKSVADRLVRLSPPLFYTRRALNIEDDHIQAVLKSLHSADIGDVEKYLPDEEDKFGFTLRAMVGPMEGEGEESFVGQLLVGSIKVEVKKKNLPCGWKFSCFATQLFKQDLFRSSAPCARLPGGCARRFGILLPAVFIASRQRSLSLPKPAKLNGAHGSGVS